MKRLVLCFSLLLALLPLQAQKSSGRKAQLEKEIALLNSQLKTNARDRDKALRNLNLVQRKMTRRKALVSESEQQIRVLDDSISRCQRDLGRLQAEYDTLSVYYERLVRSAYKNRDARLWYMYILSSDSFSQGLRRFGYLRSFSREMSAQGEQLLQMQSELETQATRLSSLKKDASALRESRVRDMKELQVEEAEVNGLVAQLKSDRARYQQQLARKQKEMSELKRKTDELIKKKTAEAKKKATTAVDAALSSSFAANKGKLPWPVEGTVTGSFGSHPHPVYKNVTLPFNNGVNVAVVRNAAVKAVFDGTVASIHVMPGYNQCILIQHGDYFTLYCRLKTVSVKEGTKVKTGQVVGVVDTIGGEDEIHFELWKGQSPQNPESWLR